MEYNNTTIVQIKPKCHNDEMIKRRATSTTQPGSPLRYNEGGAVLKIPCSGGVALIGPGRKAGIGKRSMCSYGKVDRADHGATSTMDLRFGLPYIEVAFVAHESKQ